MVRVKCNCFPGLESCELLNYMDVQQQQQLKTTGRARIYEVLFVRSYQESDIITNPCIV